MKETAVGEPFQTVSPRLWLGEVDERSGSLAPSNARGKSTAPLPPAQSHPVVTESRSCLAVMVSRVRSAEASSPGAWWKMSENNLLLSFRAAVRQFSVQAENALSDIFEPHGLL